MSDPALLPKTVSLAAASASPCACIAGLASLLKTYGARPDGGPGALSLLDSAPALVAADYSAVAVSCLEKRESRVLVFAENGEMAWFANVSLIQTPALDVNFVGVMAAEQPGFVLVEYVCNKYFSIPDSASHRDAD